MASNLPSSMSWRWNSWSSLTYFVLIVSFAFAPVANAAAYPHSRHHLGNHKRAQIGGGVDLRVLPIGDSITWGAQSSDDNGYRKTLYNLLVARGNSVEFVGTVTSGDSPSPHHEGHRGFIIDEINDASDVGIYAAPNLVLLHAGTNDMNRDVDVSSAPTRMKKLMDKIFKFSPDAVICLCQIIPSTTASTQARIDVYNEKLLQVKSDYLDQGKKVTVVSMNEALSRSDLKDNLHPNDGGYVKMANAYYAAIESVDDWITKPGKKQTPPDSTSSSSNCKATPAWKNVGSIANGAKVAHSDGPFVPGFAKRGMVAEGACPRAQVHFMDIDGDGLKDYVCVDPKTGAVKADRNIPDKDGKTSGNWEKLGTVASGKTGRAGTGVMFADLNGDGRDDYVWVDPDNGDVYGWINRLKNAAGVWQWESLGKIAGGIGATNKTLSMVDIDGDGRDDLCIIDRYTGEVTAWLNTGAASTPDYYKLGVIATGSSTTKNDKVFLGDFTGEGRADYMFVGATGKVNGFVNRLDDSNLIPAWSQMYTVAAGPDGAKQDQVRFADMTGDGKLDYMLVDEKTGNVTLWENVGTGGKYQAGEGVFLCDLDGDGTMDYFWVDEVGKGWGYLNTGKGKNEWQPLGQTAAGGYDREKLRMGVLTKTGRADYIQVDPDTGRADWWQNLGPDSNYNWASRGQLAAGPKNTIESQFEWKFNGKNVRFADLDGDKLDDYLYVNDQGAVVYWKNLGTNPITWGLPHLVADGVGVGSRQVQFADTNGDGLLDYNVVGSVTGMTRSWHNLGFRDDGSIRWNTPVSFADGTGYPGYSIRLAEMTGDKRADYVAVSPETGKLFLWINGCWPSDDDGSSGDDPTDDTGDDDDDDDEDDTDGLDDEYEFCEEEYDSLDDIPDGIKGRCGPIYVLQALHKNLTDSISLYNDIIKDGYDKKFKTYSQSVVLGAPEIIRDFYMQHGNDYFSCLVAESQMCCGECDRQWGITDAKCRYCEGDLCNPMRTTHKNISEPCPPDYSKRASDKKDYNGETIYWTLKDSKEGQFYEDLEDETGIPKEDVKIGVINHISYTGDCQKYPECYNSGWEFGVPKVTSGYEEDDVADPKDVISKYLSKAESIQKDLPGLWGSFLLGLNSDFAAEDLVDAVSVPILMISQAVQSMENVVDVAKEIWKEKKKAEIEAFLLGFLFLIPIGGEVIEAIAGFATIGRIVALIGDASVLASDLYVVAKDPSAAPFVIFANILGAGALVDGTKVVKAAKARRGMTKDDVGKLGDSMSTVLTKIDKVVAKTCSI